MLSFIAPTKIEQLYPFTMHNSQRPDTPVVLTERVRPYVQSLLVVHVSLPFNVMRSIPTVGSRVPMVK
jgi:hypothetical protein